MFCQGWFNETLPPFLARRPNAPVAAAHLDVDLYSSAVEVLRALMPRLMPGATVRFDEFYLLRAIGEKARQHFFAGHFSQIGAASPSDRISAPLWLEVPKSKGTG